MVRDEGLGIPTDEQSMVFEKFYRVDPHMTRGVGGTGLGLYICNELVSRMGGHIWLESKAGEGSTFLLSFPLLLDRDHPAGRGGDALGERELLIPPTGGRRCCHSGTPLKWDVCRRSSAGRALHS